jgi:hypothetical protein
MNYDDYDPVADDLLFRVTVKIAGMGFSDGSGRFADSRCGIRFAGRWSAEGLSLEAQGEKGISNIW